MTDYRPVLYHSRLSAPCVRIRRVVCQLGVDVELRSVLLSRRNRSLLQQVAGEARVPCLVVAGTVVRGADEIVKYLRLRYGEGG